MTGKASGKAEKEPGNRAKSTAKRTRDRKPHRIEVRVDDELIEVTPELEAAVERARKGVLSSLPEEMTTTQAAEFLDVSRPFVIKLIKQGELPHRMVGKHRRIPTDALREHRHRMFIEASAAADEMARISQELEAEEGAQS